MVPASFVNPQFSAESEARGSFPPALAQAGNARVRFADLRAAPLVRTGSQFGPRRQRRKEDGLFSERDNISPYRLSKPINDFSPESSQNRIRKSVPVAVSRFVSFCCRSPFSLSASTALAHCSQRLARWASFTSNRRQMTQRAVNVFNSFSVLYPFFVISACMCVCVFTAFTKIVSCG